MSAKHGRSGLFSPAEKDVFCVCFPERDGTDALRGELAQVRKEYFTGGRKAVHAGKVQVIRGFDGKLTGKLSRREFYWKKTAGKAVLEEAFDLAPGHVLVKRDFQGLITGRVFFDKEHRWARSEYYEPWDTVHARVSFAPGEEGQILRCDYEPGEQNPRTTTLYPLPYLEGEAEQSLVNARCGEPRLLVSGTGGAFCYCTEKELAARQQAIKELRGGTTALMPAWEIRNGTLTSEGQEEDTTVTFTSLEEYVRISPADAPEADGTEENISPGHREEAASPEEFSYTPEADEPLPEESVAAPEPAAEGKDESFVEAEAAPAEKPSLEEEPLEEPVGEGFVPEEELPEMPAPEEALPMKEPVSEELSLEEPSLEKPSLEKQPPETGEESFIPREPLCAYEGGLTDGKRDGFGAYYYENGSLCYAGFWKEDKRDGLGVSFRGEDHALHISRWEAGKPGGFVTLFDARGELRYSGLMENGKKQGAGVTFDPEQERFFVGKWEDGRPTGLGAAFDRDGSLLYYGGWKDGKREGRGTEFGPDGAIVFDGEWKGDSYFNGMLYRKLNREDPEG